MFRRFQFTHCEWNSCLNGVNSPSNVSYFWSEMANRALTTIFIILVSCHPFRGQYLAGREKVLLDLRTGIVQGESDYIRIIEHPEPSQDGRCTGRAVIRVDYMGPYTNARIKLDYKEPPKGWTLDIADCATADGFGGSGGITTNCAETQIVERQMRVYSNTLPGHARESINGGKLLRIIDDIVTEGVKLRLEVADESLKWNNRGPQRGQLQSQYLYTLSGQRPTRGEIEHSIYIGINRVPLENTSRVGSGLCKAIISLASDGEVDECIDDQSCEENAVCMHTQRSYRCSCKDGYSRQGTSCIDVDECQIKNGGCVHTCNNLPGTYECSCYPGFQLHSEGKDCIDIDECASGDHLCEECVNTIGSYECRCRDGYYLDADGCTCSSDPGCHNPDLGCAHYCVDTGNDQSICLCREGYQLSFDKKQCIQTCAHFNGGCQHICTDSPIGNLCSCHQKYNLHQDRKTCVETCGLNNGGCDRVCKDTPTGVQCSCPDGFVLQPDGRTCMDTDECQDNNGGCQSLCKNNIGGHECSCAKGFKLQADGKTCIDVDECSMNDTCDHICINTAGSFRCQCYQGYQTFGITHCGDIDECSINNGGCQHICTNQPGSYECFCEEGYFLHQNQKDCIASQCPPLQQPQKAILTCEQNDSEEKVCRLRCKENYHFSTLERNQFTYTCSAATQFQWASNNNKNNSLPSCSEGVNPPVVHQKATFLLSAEHCALNTSTDIQEEIATNMGCIELCVLHLNLSCNQSLAGHGNHRGQRSTTSTITADLEVVMLPKTPNGRCDIDCVFKKSKKKINQTFKRLRNKINRQGFTFAINGVLYSANRKSLSTENIMKRCDPGHVMMNNKCVACSVGTYYEPTLDRCIACKANYYQEEEGQEECLPCPQSELNFDNVGAASIDECGGQCLPGSFSSTGLQPCTPCPFGTYQPEAGHTHCVSCGGGLRTRSEGSTSFAHCLTPMRCAPGTFYNISRHKCTTCPRGTYQENSAMNYCINCPGSTSTDEEGVSDSNQCKDLLCRSQIGDRTGYIQSPNFPGEYPANAECTWPIRAPTGRKIIIVVPEIFLRTRDTCGDELTMRKNSSPSSPMLFRTCSNVSRPIAFTVPTQKLWIHFKSDSTNSAGGFRIHYATYFEDYEDLIKDIVGDGRLYESDLHQEILKDKETLTALLEVIADPEVYYTYSEDEHSTLLPQSFYKLLHNKVTRFFNLEQ
ncbi:signal peptide, CUB and EGF-like domain-containing protein 3 isoform X3 [Apostichopus japonicus]|uniref:signal peptide, CUB and EGF-like domain-containing protein 3 isoform X3 n=1 Tax=Stichopus japonicus TaxID=307972 RepID=UPI003AB68B50